jgi:hypothetical protein
LRCGGIVGSIVGPQRNIPDTAARCIERRLTVFKSKLMVGALVAAAALPMPASAHGGDFGTGALLGLGLGAIVASSGGVVVGAPVYAAPAPVVVYERPVYVAPRFRHHHHRHYYDDDFYRGRVRHWKHRHWDD